MLSGYLEFVNDPYSPLMDIFRLLFLAVNFQILGLHGHALCRWQLFLVVEQSGLHSLFDSKRKRSASQAAAIS